MRSSGDPKYTHLEQDLHVLIEVEAPPGQAHARLGLAIEEIKKFLVPVSKLSIVIIGNFHFTSTCRIQDHSPSTYARVNHSIQAFSQDFKSGHPKCAIGSSQMNTL